MKKTFFLSFFTLLQITSINTMQEPPTPPPAQADIVETPPAQEPPKNPPAVSRKRRAPLQPEQYYKLKILSDRLNRTLGL